MRKARPIVRVNQVNTSRTFGDGSLAQKPREVMRSRLRLRGRN